MPPPRDLAGFARAIAPAVKSAAELARSLEGRVQNVPKSAEEDVVKQALTQADEAAQEAILSSLLDLYPWVSLNAEEDTPTVSAFPTDSSDLVIIDPIDGTLHSYLDGKGPYAVIVGLAVKRQLRAAVVALPREGQLFMAEHKQGAERIKPGGKVKPVVARADGDRVLVSHNLPKRAIAKLRSEGLTPVPACGGAIAVAPLVPGVRAGLRYTRRKKRRGISTRGRVGALVAREAGAEVRGDAGKVFPTDLDAPTRSLRVAADKSDLAILEKALQAANLD